MSGLRAQDNNEELPSNLTRLTMNVVLNWFKRIALCTFSIAVCCSSNPRTICGTPLQGRDQTVNPRAIETDQTSKQNTYTNSKLGFTFSYPPSWAQYGKEAEVLDLSGRVMATEIRFVDTNSGSTLLVGHHPAPMGTELYEYSVTQCASARGCEQIIVGGSRAIRNSMVHMVDGRGHDLDPHLRVITVDLMNGDQTAAITLQFQTPVLSEDAQVPMFEQLLASFGLIIR